MKVKDHMCPTPFTLGEHDGNETTRRQQTRKRERVQQRYAQNARLQRAQNPTRGLETLTMPCYHPIAAYQAREGGRIQILGPRSDKLKGNLTVPCAKCIGCKNLNAQMWGHRSVHEASLWQHNTFATLTYNDAHLPEEGHLVARDLTLFIKRLRRSLGGDTGNNPLLTTGAFGIRYLASGEYGARYGRPHYHAIFYNLGLADAKLVGKDLYESHALNKLWTDKNGDPMGTIRAAPATFGRALYIAKYTIKDRQTERKGEVDPDGVWRPAPFLRMSTNPAIGKRWLEKYYEDLEHGYIVQNNAKRAIPRYYKKWLDKNRGYFLALLKANEAKRRVTDGDSLDRLRDGEIIATQYKRTAEQRKYL